MPHDLIVFGGASVPAHIVANPPPVSLNANAQHGIRIPFPVVSIEGRRWSVTYRGVEEQIRASPGFDVNHRPLPEVPVSTLNVIVVGVASAISKAWYAKTFQPGVKILMPDCFSTNGETPDAQSPMPQSAICLTCPKNQFESAISDDGSQGKGKACRDARKIAVVPAGDVKNAARGGPMMLRLPVMSMPNLAKYCGQLSISGVDISQVVTAMSFSDEAKYPEVVFNAVDYIQNPVDYTLAQEWMRSDIVRQMLDETPTFENTGVSPVSPTREQFHQSVDTRSPFNQDADDQLTNETDPEEWIRLLSYFAETTSSNEDLTGVFSLPCVRTQRDIAPLSYRNRIQTILDTAINRLSPHMEDEPAPPAASMAVIQSESRDTSAPIPDQSRDDAPEVDAANVIWDARIHASTKAKTEKGLWRARRGADPDVKPTVAATPSAPEPGLFDDPTPQETITETPAQPPTFSHYLLDETGRPLPDADGVLEPFTDPVRWAEEYTKVMADMFPGDIPQFQHANGEAARAAIIASTEVVAIISGGGYDGITDDALTPIAAPTTKAGMEDYKKALQKALADCTAPDQINLVIDANEPVYGKFPAISRTECKAIVETRQKALSGIPYAAVNLDAPTLARTILDDLASLQTIRDFQAWQTNTSAIAETERVRREAPDQFPALQQAIAKREVELRPSVIKSEWDGMTPAQVSMELNNRIASATSPAHLKEINGTPSFTAGGKIVQNEPGLWKKLGENYFARKATLEGKAPAA